LIQGSNTVNESDPEEINRITANIEIKNSTTPKPNANLAAHLCPDRKTSTAATSGKNKRVVVIIK
jgi:hypothetical protein